MCLLFLAEVAKARWAARWAAAKAKPEAAVVAPETDDEKGIMSLVYDSSESNSADEEENAPRLRWQVESSSGDEEENAPRLRWPLRLHGVPAAAMQVETAEGVVAHAQFNHGGSYPANSRKYNGTSTRRFQEWQREHNACGDRGRSFPDGRQIEVQHLG